MSREPASYAQIVKASSIMAGASGINYLVGLIRVKAGAILLGPAGVGLISLYTSTLGLVGSVTGGGIANSGVREIAQLSGAGDARALGRAAAILLRASWCVGIVGWLAAIASARWVSTWLFGDTSHARDLGLLGGTLLLGALSAGQLAVIQGVRRVGDVARAQILMAILGTLATIALFALLGANGVVPALIAVPAISLMVAWRIGLRARIARERPTWRETMAGARRMAGLGVAFMWSGILLAAMDMFTRTIITREHGVDAAGIYQAAWAVSGLFAGFIIGAMSTDFFPRLASVIDDHAEAQRTVNEQTEVGILLALPGLLATLAFAPWLIQIFYSRRFLESASLLPWFVVGMFGRIVSWPMGFILLAKGASRWFAATETGFVAVQMILVWWLVRKFGIVGATYSFAAAYAVYAASMLVVGRVLIGFRWSRQAKKTLLMAGAFIVAGLIVRLSLRGADAILAGGGVLALGAVASVRGLGSRIGARNVWMTSAVKKVIDRRRRAP